MLPLIRSFPENGVFGNFDLAGCLMALNLPKKPDFPGSSRISSAMRGCHYESPGLEKTWRRNLPS